MKKILLDLIMGHTVAARDGRFINDGPVTEVTGVLGEPALYITLRNRKRYRLTFEEVDR